MSEANTSEQGKNQAINSPDGITFRVGNPRGDGLQRAMAAVNVAIGNHARDPVLLDTRKITSLFDYFLIVTGASRRQVYAIAEEIHLELRRVWNDRRIGFEGAEECRWIILDYGDLVIHVFDAEARDYYQLEDLWAAAESIDLSSVIDTPNSTAVPERSATPEYSAVSEPPERASDSSDSSDSVETDDA